MSKITHSRICGWHCVLSLASLLCVINLGDSRLVAQPIAPLPQVQTNDAARNFSGDLRDQISRTPFINDEPAVLRVEDSPTVDQFGVSLADFEIAALSNHPAVEKIAAQIREAKWRCQRAGLHPDMRIGYDGAEMGNEGTSGLQGGFISQQFITGKKHRLDQCVISKEIEHLQQKLAEVRQRILTDVRIELVSAYTEQERIKVLQRSLDLNLRAEESAKDLIDNSEIPRRAYLEIRSIADVSELKLSSAKQEYLASWRRLLSLCGFEGPSQTTLSNDIVPSKDPPIWDETLASVLAASPELAAAFARIEKHRYEIGRARSERHPNISTLVAYQYDEATGDDIASVVASIPIPRKRRVQAEIGQATARLRQAEQHVELVTRAIRHRLATEFEKLESACHETTVYEKRILPRFVESRSLAKQSLDNGEINYLEWVSSERAFLKTMEEYLNAQRKCWIGKYRIQGFLLSDSFDLNRGS